MDLLKQCRQFYEECVDLLASVDGPCMVHRDYRPGNLIVHNGKLQGIIDWAGARASFAEEDFCSIEQGEWTSESHIKNALLCGYESIRPIPNYARLIHFLRLNKAIATIGFTIKCGTWQGSSARLYQHNRQVLETLLGDKRFISTYSYLPTLFSSQDPSMKKNKPLIDPTLEKYYAEGNEKDRLSTHRLERDRTLQILKKRLPSPPTTILWDSIKYEQMLTCFQGSLEG